MTTGQYAKHHLLVYIDTETPHCNERRLYFIYTTDIYKDTSGTSAIKRGRDVSTVLVS
jgi:hypothetical protein